MSNWYMKINAMKRYSAATGCSRATRLVITPIKSQGSLSISAKISIGFFRSARPSAIFAVRS